MRELHEMMGRLRGPGQSPAAVAHRGAGVEVLGTEERMREYGRLLSRAQRDGA